VAQEKEFTEVLRRERLKEDILLSGQDPISKLQGLMRLGYSEETANDIVERYQFGQVNPVYYERIDFEESGYDDIDRIT